MRKRYVLIFLLCWAAVLYAFFYNDIQKYATIHYIKNNYEELEQYAIRFIDEGYANTTTSYGEWRVDYWAHTNKVEFMVDGRGLAPASTYEGFYYSPDDKPIGFQGSAYRFTVEGSGWVWKNETSDNREYAEKIIDKWYWFKAIF